MSPLSRDWLETYDLDSGWEDEMSAIAAGKDFALLRTSHGKVRDTDPGPERVFNIAGMVLLPLSVSFLHC